MYGGSPSPFSDVCVATAHEFGHGTAGQRSHVRLNGLLPGFARRESILDETDANYAILELGRLDGSICLYEPKGHPAPVVHPSSCTSDLAICRSKTVTPNTREAVKQTCLSDQQILERFLLEAA
jgi:hypothetical protein